MSGKKGSSSNEHQINEVKRSSALSSSSSLVVSPRSHQPVADQRTTMSDVGSTLSAATKKRRRLYHMPIQLSSSSVNGNFSAAGCCFGFRRQACLLVALAAFQTLAVVTIIVSALSEASGVSHVTPMSIITSGSGYGDPASFVDQLGTRLNAIALGIPPPSEIGSSPSDELNVTLIEMQSVLYNADCVETFLSHYEQFCQSNLWPGSGIVRSRSANSPDNSRNTSDATMTTKTMIGQTQSQLELCPCVPRQRLVGRLLPLSTASSSSADDTPAAFKELSPGGRWYPRNCVARQRLAIIVPFRDREAHLSKFLRVVHPMLQRQMVDYTIFVIEQEQPKDIFNKASLMNAGFLEARKIGYLSTILKDAAVVNSGGPYDCFMFHDVDMLPEDDRNFYGCGARLPRHVGAYVDKWDYNLMYYRIFGGATSFRPDVFEMINGFSNEFYGWGGEDDDMLNRIEAKNMTFVRFPKCVATYSMIKHNPDKRNPYNKASVVAWKRRPKLYEENGLNSIRYKLVAAERRPLYTWLLVNLPPAPT